MTAVILLAEARRFGACFAVSNAQVLVEAPAPLPDSLVAELRAHKDALLVLLTTTNEGGRDSVDEWWQERAAIMEFDGGLSREEAERQSWAQTLAYFGLPASYRFH